MNREQARKWFQSHKTSDSMVNEAYDMAIEALTDRPKGEWTNKGGEPIKDNFCVYCSKCKEWSEYRTDFCPNCGADMRSEKEYLDKTFPEHEGGEWFDITDMMTKEGEE